MNVTLVEAAELCCAAYAMYDAYNTYGMGITSISPKLDASVAARWTLIGHVTGEDAIFNGQQFGLGSPTWYGFVAMRVDGTDPVVVLRGTKTPVEWLEDLEAQLTGNVEFGFYSIYRTLRASCDIPPGTTFIGHSLGAALATYWCEVTSNAKGIFLASPKPGDSYFSAAFDVKVLDYIVVNYLRDIVPRLPLTVPLLADFESLSKVRWVRPSESTAIIPDNIASNHGAGSYLALLRCMKTAP